MMPISRGSRQPARRCLWAAFLAVVLAASPQAFAATDPAVKRPVREYVNPDAVHPIDVPDPIERANRWMYQFNAMFDRFVFYPVASGYVRITPRPVRNCVTRFFSNLMEVRNFMNNLLQAKAEGCVNSAMRFCLNSTLGMGGLFDPAKEAGYPQRNEDFGQTLGVWGFGAGPYIVLPFFGPSNLRDTGGALTDGAIYLLMTNGIVGEIPADAVTRTAVSSGVSGLRAVDTRANIPFRYYETGSPFEYELLRLLYTKMREIEVEN
ncbi:MAG: VacJ family lipoprotein [Desulfobacterales bacterium]